MKNIALIAIAAILASCNLNKVKYETYTYEDKFQLDVPEFMSETDDLLDGAPMQFESMEKEMYTLVIDEDKEMLKSVFFSIPEVNKDLPLIEQYCEMQELSTSGLMDITNESGPNKSTINDMDARIMEYEGYPQGLELKTYYYIAIVEGVNAIYKITSWCLIADKEKNRPIFEQMAASFQEL